MPEITWRKQNECIRPTGDGENQNKGEGGGTRGGVTEEPGGEAGNWASLEARPCWQRTHQLQDGDRVRAKGVQGHISQGSAARATKAFHSQV